MYDILEKYANLSLYIIYNNCVNVDAVHEKMYQKSLYVKYENKYLANLPNLYPLFYRDHGRRVKTRHHAPFVQQFQVPVEGSTCATMTRVTRII